MQQLDDLQEVLNDPRLNITQAKDVQVVSNTRKQSVTFAIVSLVLMSLEREALPHWLACLSPTFQKQAQISQVLVQSREFRYTESLNSDHFLSQNIYSSSSSQSYTYFLLIKSKYVNYEAPNPPVLSMRLFHYSIKSQTLKRHANI